MSAGIYRILNKTNGKCYVGSSSDISSRLKEHRRDLLSKRHINKHLQASWDKYGEDVFIFELLEEVEPTSSKLLDREDFWISFHRSNEKDFGYNIRKVSGSNLGIAWSDEYKDNMSAAQNRPEVVYKKRQSSLGKHPSEETRRKMSLSQKVAQNRSDVKDRKSKRQKEVWSSKDKRDKLSASIKKSWERDREKRTEINREINSRTSVIEKKKLRFSGSGNPMFGRVGDKHPSFGKTGMAHPMFGRHHSEESRHKISVSQKELQNRPEVKEVRRLAATGENNPRSVLTLEKVKEIREKYSTGKYTQAQLAREYGVKSPAVWKIIKNISWKT